MDKINVLLSYTYFLKSNSTLITLGYDAITFDVVVYICKNGVAVKLYHFDWVKLHQICGVVTSFFAGAAETPQGLDQISNDVSACAFKLTKRKSGKYLVIWNNGHKICINEDEWNRLYELIPFMQSIITWYSLTTREISSYYWNYVEKCRLSRSTVLQPCEYFVQSSANFLCNYSRLFSEIPLLCKNKLKLDVLAPHPRMMESDYTYANVAPILNSGHHFPDENTPNSSSTINMAYDYAGGLNYANDK